MVYTPFDELYLKDWLLQEAPNYCYKIPSQTHNFCLLKTPPKVLNIVPTKTTSRPWKLNKTNLNLRLAKMDFVLLKVAKNCVKLGGTRWQRHRHHHPSRVCEGEAVAAAAGRHKVLDGEWRLFGAKPKLPKWICCNDSRINYVCSYHLGPICFINTLR